VVRFLSKPELSVKTIVLLTLDQFHH